MNQKLIIFLGALIVGLITVGIGTAYTSKVAHKTPEQREYIQLMISGSLVGGFVSWVVASGYFHGYSFLNMVGNDVKSVAKTVKNTVSDELGIKGGMETVPLVPNSSLTTVTQMVGGFLNSLGVGSVAQELNIGIPNF